MALFRRKRRQPTPVRPTGMTENPLAAVPVVVDDVKTVAQGKDGDVMLEVDITQRRGKLYQKVSKRLHYNNKRNVHLDTMGGRFWRQIDGHRNLLDISRTLAKTLERPEPEIHAAVVSYVKDLMRRNLIYLKMPRTDTTHRQ